MQTWTQYSCLIHSTGSDSLIKVHTCPAPCVGCFVFLSLLMPQFLLVFSRCEGKGNQAYSQKHLLAPSYCPRNRRRWTDFFLTETWLQQIFLEREDMFLKLSRHWVSSIMSSKHRKLQVSNLAQSEISAATLIRPENTIWSWCCSDKQSSCGMGLSSMILHLWHCDWPLGCWCFEEVPLPWKASNMQSRNTRRHSPAQGDYSELHSIWRHTDMLHRGHAATNNQQGSGRQSSSMCFKRWKLR